MRQAAWEEVKIALYDYPRFDYYINRLRNERLYPYKPSDINSGITSGGFSPDGIERKVIKINDDLIYQRLLFQKETIERTLMEYVEIKPMIEMMYFSRNRIALKPASELANVSWRRAKRLHEAFMHDLAEALGIVTFE